MSTRRWGFENTAKLRHHGCSYLYAPLNGCPYCLGSNSEFMKKGTDKPLQKNKRGCNFQ